jgi:flavin-dependent dehydrogenase
LLGPGWALVGDAGYFKDPITTHGMSDAMRDAELLTDALLAALSGAPEKDALVAYERMREGSRARCLP